MRTSDRDSMFKVYLALPRKSMNAFEGYLNDVSNKQGIELGVEKIANLALPFPANPLLNDLTILPYAYDISRDCARSKMVYSQNMNISSPKYDSVPGWAINYPKANILLVSPNLDDELIAQIHKNCPGLKAELLDTHSSRNKKISVIEQLMGLK